MFWSGRFWKYPGRLNILDMKDEIFPMTGIRQGKFSAAESHILSDNKIYIFHPKKYASVKGSRGPLSFAALKGTVEESDSK